MTDPVILLGTQSNGETLPVQVDEFGRLVAEGLKGDPGDPGNDGNSATVDAGTTTTGEPGTNAQVSNSGSTQNAGFDFVPVTGQDATVGGIQNVLAGRQSMTVYKAIRAEARAANPGPG